MAEFHIHSGNNPERTGSSGPRPVGDPGIALRAPELWEKIALATGRNQADDPDWPSTIVMAACKLGKHLEDAIGRTPGAKITGPMIDAAYRLTDQELQMSGHMDEVAMTVLVGIWARGEELRDVIQAGQSSFFRARQIDRWALPDFR